MTNSLTEIVYLLLTLESVEVLSNTVFWLRRFTNIDKKAELFRKQVMNGRSILDSLKEKFIHRCSVTFQMLNR